MLKELFSNRLFIGALAFFILSVVGGTLYISHVEKQGVEELATDEDRVKQVPEEQQQPTAKAPVGEETPQGHFHEDGTWHGESHDAPKPVQPTTAEVSDTTAPAAETAPLAPITFEEYKRQFDEWENAHRDEWGIARTADGGVVLLPEPPGEAGIWQTREEKEKASDLWWEHVQKRAAASRETFNRLNERDRQLGGR